MKFAIISHVPHGIHKGKYFAYAPYVREMNIWLRFVSEVKIVAPLELMAKSPIHLDYEHPKIGFSVVKQMDLLSLKGLFLSLIHMPKIVIEIFMAMKSADHIHLRCPGNIGLIGCFIQILFPHKSKTAKYAGNWDPNAKQPLTYRIQKWILNNTFLTRNMQVVVYGEWPRASKNIKPFFTATYTEADKTDIAPRSLQTAIKLLFVGTISLGKQPLFAVQVVERLKREGRSVSLHIYGEGSEMKRLTQYCDANRLNDFIYFHGNQTEGIIRAAYQQSHFLILPSKSEGWPKVVAEAMFWGCVPVVSPVSCIPFMLGHGERGIILKMHLEEDVRQLQAIISNQSAYDDKVLKSMAWSRQYTLDLFQIQIQALLNQ